MLKSTDIRDARFSKSVSGYKKEEVDELLDQVEADYKQFSKIVQDYEAKIKAFESEKEAVQSSSDSIQSVLLNAQRLAEQIVAEAEQKSREILKNAQNNIDVMSAKEKELASVFEMRANERKATLEKELADLVRKEEGKASATRAAAENAVERQQMLFEKLQMEMATFRSTIMAKYREHLELLKELPETVPVDAARMAELAGNAYEKVPTPDSFLSTEKQTIQTFEDIRSEKEPEEDLLPKTQSAAASEGFKVSL